MTLHLLWGIALWLSISKYGLGISTDSVHLLFGGLNLSEGRGLISFDGSFLLAWPPLYPALIGLVHLASRSNPFVSATILQFASFLGLSSCLSVLYLKIFPDNFLLACAANLLSDVGVVVLTTFDIVGSDYAHLFFVMLLVLLAGYYIEHPSPRLLLGMSVAGMLAILQRYLGIAAIGTGIVAILFFTDGGWRQRVGHSLLLALSVLPGAIWLLITSVSVQRRPPTGFMGNFELFSRSVLEWFLPPDLIEAHLDIYIASLWTIVVGLSVFLLVYASHHKRFPPFAIPVFVYGLLYLLTLFGSASITFFNKLDGRFLLPFYIPVITLVVVSAGALLELASRLDSVRPRGGLSIVPIGILCLAALGLLRVTLPPIREARANGAAGENSFNTEAWHENRALKYWLNHSRPGDYILLSNYSDAVAFYTWRPVMSTPRRFSGPYGTQEFPVAQYTPELFSSGSEVYDIWIEPNEYTYFYKVEELSPIAEIETLYQSQDGGVYRLRPKSGP